MQISSLLLIVFENPAQTKPVDDSLGRWHPMIYGGCIHISKTGHRKISAITQRVGGRIHFSGISGRGFSAYPFCGDLAQLPPLKRGAIIGKVKKAYIFI